MTTNNLFSEINDTVRIIKNLAKKGLDNNYSFEKIKQLLTIEQWRHIVVLMKILRLSKSVPDTNNITKFSKTFCNQILRYDYDDCEESHEMTARLLQCFNIALYQADKITPPMVHLAEILTLICGKDVDSYYNVFHKIAINEYFYANYEPCDGDFYNIINRSSRGCAIMFVRKYFTTMGGLVMLDNALILTTIVNDGWGDFKISDRVVETIQKRLINYAMSKNANVYNMVKQYSDLYNTIAENIVYNTDFGCAIKRQMTLLEQTIINRVTDFDDPIHETIFNYPKDMRLTVIYSTGFGTKGNIVEQISNIMDRNATILKKYYKNASKQYVPEFSFGKYLSTIGDSTHLTDKPDNDKIIAINKGNQLEAVTKYLLLIKLDEKLNQIFDETTAAKIFLASIKRLEFLIGNYYNRMLDISLNAYKTFDTDGNSLLYDGKVDWDIIESEARPYVGTLLNVFERVSTPKCTVKAYPPIVRIAVAYYYEQVMLRFDSLENKITEKINDNYVKTMFGNVTVETFNQRLREEMKQLLAAKTDDNNIIDNNVDKVVKEWEFYSLCRRSMKSDYVAETINKIC